MILNLPQSKLIQFLRYGVKRPSMHTVEPCGRLSILDKMRRFVFFGLSSTDIFFIGKYFFFNSLNKLRSYKVPPVTALGISGIIKKKFICNH